jgi:hypothetical protein
VRRLLYDFRNRYTEKIIKLQEYVPRKTIENIDAMVVPYCEWEQLRQLLQNI